MKTYHELRMELEGMKQTVREAIIAVLVQAPAPMTAKEIAAHLNGVTTNEVAAYLAANSNQFQNACWGLKVRINSTKHPFSKTYVNPADPTDTVTVTREVRQYWAERR